MGREITTRSRNRGCAADFRGRACIGLQTKSTNKNEITKGEIIMFSKRPFFAYKRFIILMILLAGLAIFDYSERTQRTLAVDAPCQQDCDRYWEMCNDSCQAACETSDESCNTCLSNCGEQWSDCLEHSIYCQTGNVAYAPSCSVEFGTHCPIVNGQPDCTNSHNGYHEVCTRIGYENGCLVCPENESCQNNPNNLPYCL